MTALAPTLEAFFTDRLIRQRQVSTHSVIAYRDTFRLLLGFVQTRTGRAPSTLNLEDLDAALISAFLDHLEVDRHNKTRTRNARLAAVHSLFRFAALTLLWRDLCKPVAREWQGCNWSLERSRATPLNGSWSSSAVSSRGSRGCASAPMTCAGWSRSYPARTPSGWPKFCRRPRWSNCSSSWSMVRGTPASWMRGGWR